tara:strand:+ start:2724 stop:4076 length:1353 start_codon:yes stop_codon:yes gene_type:complete
MAILKPGENSKSNLRNYYDNLKRDNWSGTARKDLFTGKLHGSRYIGLAGRSKQIRDATLLGGLYLLGNFRSVEPRLFTAGKYAVAPIINTTTLGKAAKLATNVLRAGQQLGVVPSELTNTYADIKKVRSIKDVAKRVTSIFKEPVTPKEYRKKYGLQYGRDTSFDPDLAKSLYPGGKPDIIPVIFHGFDTSGDEIRVPVRGMLNGFSDTVTPTWNEHKYVGRPQSVVTYGGFARDVAFNLQIAAVAGHDLRNMWRKINDIANFVLPQTDNPQGSRFAGRLVSVTVGSYMEKELCAMTGFTITPNEDAMWEIMDPDLHHPSVTLSKSLGNLIQDKIQRKLRSMRLKKLAALKAAPPLDPTGKIQDKIKVLERQTDTFIPPTPRLQEKADRLNQYDRFIMPRVVDVAISLKVLHNRVPGARGGLVGKDGLIKDSMITSDKFEIGMKRRTGNQ